jgi:toxin ParE1/3/4
VPRSKREPVAFTRAASADIDVAFAFVSERNRAAALELLTRMEGAAKRLATFPDMGTPLPEESFGFVEPGIRFVLVDPYVMFYRATDAGVVVLRVLHSRQDSLGSLFG